MGWSVQHMCPCDVEICPVLQLLGCTRSIYYLLLLWGILQGQSSCLWYCGIFARSSTYSFALFRPSSFSFIKESCSLARSSIGLTNVFDTADIISSAQRSPSERILFTGTSKALAIFCNVSILGHRAPDSYCCRLIVGIPARAESSF